MLAIRMRRLGAKKRPFFRVVVIDSHAARDGRALEVLGHYNPTTVPETFHLDHQRFDHWLTKGAQPSDTLRTLLTRHPAGDEAADRPTAPAAAPAAPSARAAEPAQPAATPEASTEQTDPASTAEAAPTEPAAAPAEEPKDS